MDLLVGEYDVGEKKGEVNGLVFHNAEERQAIERGLERIKHFHFGCCDQYTQYKIHYDDIYNYESSYRDFVQQYERGEITETELEAEHIRLMRKKRKAEKTWPEVLENFRQLVLHMGRNLERYPIPEKETTDYSDGERKRRLEKRGEENRATHWAESTQSRRSFESV